MFKFFDASSDLEYIFQNSSMTQCFIDPKLILCIGPDNPEFEQEHSNVNKQFNLQFYGRYFAKPP